MLGPRNLEESSWTDFSIVLLSCEIESKSGAGPLIAPFALRLHLYMNIYT